MATIGCDSTKSSATSTMWDLPMAFSAEHAYFPALESLASSFKVDSSPLFSSPGWVTYTFSVNFFQGTLGEIFLGDTPVPCTVPIFHLITDTPLCPVFEDTFESYVLWKKWNIELVTWPDFGFVLLQWQSCSRLCTRWRVPGCLGWHEICTRSQQALLSQHL